LTKVQALNSLNSRGQLRVAGLWDRCDCSLAALEARIGRCPGQLRSHALARSQPHWIGGRGNDWRMLLQADYSASFRMDAVHRGRQINESVMDDVAASMLGE
jgi:hypothetical protein